MLPTSCRTCAIRDAALCRALPDGALAQLNQIARRRRYHAGAQIFSGHEDRQLVASIVHGVVRHSKALSDGRTQIVALQFASDFLGLPTSPQNAVLTEAATDVELCTFTRAQLDVLVRAHPAVQTQLMQRLAKDLEDARDWMVLLGRKTAEERVASFIMLCLAKHRKLACGATGTSAGERIELPLSRTDIADYLGITLETVARKLRQLSDDGVIAINTGRFLTVLDTGMLQARAEPA
ncbi:MAG TPA: Crp/Fnr family transcriptional regulator [Hyphomicrobiaceae bacterium]|nr:Crp/Fnr family transcriptional regulator [Hyphomicrobiaceae bacterium]